MTSEQTRILYDFGLSPADRIGEGSESFVYALGTDAILRLPKAGRFAEHSRERLQIFLDHISGNLPFATPCIEEVGPDDTWTIERRLKGRSMLELVRVLDDDRRDHAFRNYVEAAEALRKITLPEFPYGHVLAQPAVTADDWRTFAWESLITFRTRNRVTIARDVGDPYSLFEKAAEMVSALPLSPPKALVHGDFFPGNVLLADDLSVSAVLDFGSYTSCGDPTLDLAVSFLTLEMVEECTSDDARFVRQLILERHGEEIAPALRFYRAYLAFSMADPDLSAAPYPRLYGWAIAMLKLLAADRLPG